MLREKARMFARSQGGVTVPRERREFLRSSFMVEEIENVPLSSRGVLSKQSRVGEEQEQGGEDGFHEKTIRKAQHIKRCNQLPQREHKMHRSFDYAPSLSDKWNLIRRSA
jgi:hypothetical protein